ncbi:MAG: hypothetical protein GY747_08930 [Planctomycetes bacterium]|nr:hypothetical protein [Planctomycetota bacterium]MCP4771311.1 hypothetical protein [Planctomycetota bacterium]MCP4860456.1 hypothetical protein [Planctomycetota bacterium]
MADRWLSAIENHDWDGMGQLLHEDAVYDDRSMTYFGDGAEHLNGRDAIVGFWRSSDEDSGAQTTILTTRDGLISHVEDYVDYGDAINQVNAHRKRYGKLVDSLETTE